MAKFITDKIDFSGLTSSDYPQSGLLLFGFDVADNKLKAIDSTGLITEIGGGVPMWFSGTGVNSIVSISANTALGTNSYAQGYGNIASGNYSHVEGYGSIASGDTSHAEGGDTFAGGQRSHAEGWKTTTSGFSSHAEGEYTLAVGEGSHAEGDGSYAFGIGSHAEGYQMYAGGRVFSGITGTSVVNGIVTIDAIYGDVTSAFTQYDYAFISDVLFNNSIGVNASEISAVTFNSPNTIISLYNTSLNTNGSCYIADLSMLNYPSANIVIGDYSHAEGNNGVSLGINSHVQNYSNLAFGDNSSASGLYTQALGVGSESSGTYSVASGIFSHAEGGGTSAYGTASHAEGIQTTASGYSSHAEGNYTIALGDKSHAEGNITTAIGVGSHTEGSNTIAIGNYAHAGGQNTIASGGASHSEGIATTASGDYSVVGGTNSIASGFSAYAFGEGNLASGEASHAEGEGTTASGEGSHAEGIVTTTIGFTSHAEGFGNIANGNYSHAEGQSTTAYSDYSHTEGSLTTASGNYAHAEGYQNIASGGASHAEGNNTTASGEYSHAEGIGTWASGPFVHAEGYFTLNNGFASHVEGENSTSTGEASHSEGANTIAVSFTSHAEGYGSTSVGSYSHSEGYVTTAIGEASHAEGQFTTALGDYSHSEGNYTFSLGTYSHAGGNYTLASGDTSFVHGNNSVAGSHSTIILGDNITGTTANSTYVEDLIIKKHASIPVNSSDPIGEDGSVTWDSSNFYWKTNGQWLAISGFTFDNTSNLPTITTTSISNAYYPQATGGGDVTSSGASPVTAYGVVWSLNPNPSLSDSYTVDGSGTGSFISTLTGITNYNTNYYVRAYATNSSGTIYGNEVIFQLTPCLAEGTKIRLSDNTYKNIEDIVYDDSLLVWNFDDATFETANPIWIKEAQRTDRYNKLVFSDGSVLKTIGQHRIFNVEKGMFTYPMTEDTPIGTTTFNSRGDMITLISKEIVMEDVNYYNIMTDKHINLFAEDILTSSRYNNIYPIRDMKFVKDNRVLRTREDFASISDKYYYGLRLSEQSLSMSDIESGVEMLERLEVKVELV